MKRTLAIVLVLSACTSAQALAQGSGACFRPNEIRAEANVRMSFMLRERARACSANAGSGDFADLPKRWNEFEGANAAKINQAVDTRRKAIARAFKSPENSETAQNERLINAFRQEPAYEASCKQIADILGKLGTEQWGGLEKRGREFDNEIRRDWPAC